VVGAPIVLALVSIVVRAAVPAVLASVVLLPTIA